jgi:hypothetical protein
LSLPSPVQGDQFGAAFAFGDFLGTNGTQLAVGAPGRGNGGKVALFSWTGGHLVAGPTVSQSVVASQTTIGPQDSFGASLRAAKLRSGHTDLVVGAPGKLDGGEVMVLRADTTTFTSGTVRRSPVGGSQYGIAISSGDLDGDGNTDVVAGQDLGIGETLRSGVVVATQGTPNGLGSLKLWRFPSFLHEE